MIDIYHKYHALNSLTTVQRVDISNVKMRKIIMTAISLREIQREFKPFGILVRSYQGYFQALNVDNAGTSIQAESLALLRPAIYRALSYWF